jgi:O-antigen/teichoic acid export membrane protein
VRWFAKPVADAEAFLQGEIVRNAASLYGTTIVTSALGFIYWFVAASMASARALGLASATQSAAAFLSIVCVLGLSTLLISELARDRSPARSLMLTATVVVSIVALALTPLVGLCLQQFSTTLRQALQADAGFYFSRC